MLVADGVFNTRMAVGRLTSNRSAAWTRTTSSPLCTGIVTCCLDPRRNLQPLPRAPRKEQRQRPVWCRKANNGKGGSVQPNWSLPPKTLWMFLLLWILTTPVKPRDRPRGLAPHAGGVAVVAGFVDTAELLEHARHLNDKLSEYQLTRLIEVADAGKTGTVTQAAEGWITGCLTQ